jgi:hypothetical protein
MTSILLKHDPGIEPWLRNPPRPVNRKFLDASTRNASMNI